VAQFASLFQFKKERVREEGERLFLGFDAGDQAFALEVSCVREIVRVPKITSLPKVPAFVKGIIDLRGEILPVLDLKERLGLGSVDNRKGRAVVMVPGGNQPLGLLVDAATEVFGAGPGDILPPPEALRQPQLAFIEAVVRTPGRLYYLLKPGSLLTAKEFQALEARPWSAAGRTGP
jgi:purine-binding chemotaxis protein CheW